MQFRLAKTRTLFLSLGLFLPFQMSFLFLPSVVLHAQQLQAKVSGTVMNAKGRPVANVQILSLQGKLLSVTDSEGVFAIAASTKAIQIAAREYVTATVTIKPGESPQIILEQPLGSITVTAYRSPLASQDSPASTRILNTQQLRQAAAPALDGKLRQIPGFELFRRSSSLVANPTTEGVSLRGLGSTAASRSLVVFDDIPLNDPYGGWVHWQELPELAIHSVEVVRGGASDLYGSSAIGGVINVIPVRPQANSLQLSTSYGGLATTENALLGTTKFGKWYGLAAGGLTATDGYTLIAPQFRGPVDQPSNVHAQNAMAELDRSLSPSDRIFLRGSMYNDARHNGTPLTTNGTRLWRAATGADWNNLVLRLYGDNEHYRQTFSSIATGRVSEKLTRYAEDPATELGAVVHWHHSLADNLLVLAGADTHDVRAADYETLYTGTNPLLYTTARQRQTGEYGEILFTPAAWTISGSARVDHFSNFDARQYTSITATSLPSFSETVFDPRLGLTRRILPNLALNASAFRAYRAPTQNELYRTGQVGQQVTQPNPNLRSERATGWEAGFQTDLPHYASSLRVSYFWTQVNRPITALTLSTTPTQTLLKRNNLGQIESRGISLDFATQPVRWIALEGGYQYADATVTKFAQQPNLVGKWIPQVPRNMATAQARFTQPRIGLLSLQARYGGRQFDDDQNTNLLHNYFRLDVYASHNLGKHAELYTSAENLFDRAIEVGRTPVLTLGTPRVARFGLRLNFGD